MARLFKIALCLAIILALAAGCVPPPRDSGPPRKPAPQRPEPAPSRPDPSRPDSSRPGTGPSRPEQAPPQREPDRRGSGASRQSAQRQNDQRQNDQRQDASRQDVEYDFAAFARTGEWGFICHAAMLGSKEAAGLLREKGVRCGS